MTDPNYSHLIFVVDRSGSMQRTATDATGGIHQYLRDQTVIAGKKTFSLYQFDTEHDRVFSFAPLAKGLTYELQARGLTALQDAIMNAVTREGEALAAMEEDQRPGRVVLTIVTDGDENASVEFYGAEGLAQVKELLTQQQNVYSWQVSYIGANVNAFANAAAMGINQEAAANYTSSHLGTQNAFAMASAGTSRYLRGSSAGISYTQAERDASMTGDD